MLARTLPAIVICDRTATERMDITPISSAVRHPRHSSWMLSRLTNETKAHHIGIDEGLLVSRVRTGWLASDLLGIGLTPVESAMLHRRLEIPVFASGAEALGWL